jgi:hypothetical protein
MMTTKNSIDDNDAPTMAAAMTGNPPPSTGQRPHLRSDGSLPAPLVQDVQGMARPHILPPPPAPDKSNILSDDNRSPPLLSDPDDVDFQVVAAGCRQRVTPLQEASPTMAETLPPTTGTALAPLPTPTIPPHGHTTRRVNRLPIPLMHSTRPYMHPNLISLLSFFGRTTHLMHHDADDNVI